MSDIVRPVAPWVAVFGTEHFDREQNGITVSQTRDTVRFYNYGREEGCLTFDDPARATSFSEVLVASAVIVIDLRRQTEESPVV